MHGGVWQRLKAFPRPVTAVQSLRGDQRSGDNSAHWAQAWAEHYSAKIWASSVRL